jgi:hypothetical protein
MRNDDHATQEVSAQQKKNRCTRILHKTNRLPIRFSPVNRNPKTEDQAPRAVR